jgi:hypothetical protein
MKNLKLNLLNMILVWEFLLDIHADHKNSNQLHIEEDNWYFEI